MITTQQLVAQGSEEAYEWGCRIERTRGIGSPVHLHLPAHLAAQIPWLQAVPTDFSYATFGLDDEQKRSFQIHLPTILSSCDKTVLFHF
ncbi:hypothetical protein R2Q26_00760 [Nitrosomonas sp. Is37]|nr:hypothetical protein [Nitrosomonas sp. Is37]MDV6343094.1 hypothetical protein [Nitrosomonas sp. Is37]